MDNKFFLIHAPGNAIAGGCESLHQLGDAINRLGGNAMMCYYPHDQVFSIPDKFSDYHVKSSEFIDDSNMIHIFPEIYTKLSQKVKRGKKCIFWLSVDNYYFKKDHFTRFERYKKFYGSLLTARLPVFRMQNFIHLLQSEYSRIHFKDKNFKKFYIGDYIKYDELFKSFNKRENRVLYNPAKGLHITKALIERNPDLTFIPLKGYSIDELKQVMRASKIYIDFGNHPGRDRLPREFVLDGGVIISGLRGSAGNSLDIKIPDRYKVDTNNTACLSEISLLINDIFNDFDNAIMDMASYRNIIIEDQNLHLKNVQQFLDFFN